MPFNFVTARNILNIVLFHDHFIQILCGLHVATTQLFFTTGLPEEHQAFRRRHILLEVPFSESYWISSNLVLFIAIQDIRRCVTDVISIINKSIALVSKYTLKNGINAKDRMTTFQTEQLY